MSVRELDFAYLNRTVGPPLQQAVKEIMIVCPQDPVEYLGHWLKNWADSQARVQEMQDEMQKEAQRLRDENEVRLARVILS
jgi:hypothetical protein